MPDPKNINLQINTLGVIKIIAILLGLFFLYLIKDLIIILFVSLIFAVALNPIVNKWEEKGIKRVLSLVLIYLILFAILGIIISTFVPTIINQFKDLIQNISPYFKNLPNLSADQGQTAGSNLQKALDSFSALFKAESGLFSGVISLFGGFGSFLFILVITFYLVLDKESIKKFFYSFIPVKYQNYLMPFLQKFQEKIGLWFKGQMILCLIIGALCYIGLLIIGIKFALVLALLAGITEIIPYLGPFLGAIPAVLIALLYFSPMKALLVVILYILVQQLENTIITPRIMGKAIDLNPIIIICSLWVGGKIGGILGMLIAVPVAGILSILFKDYLEYRKKTNE